MSWRSSANTPRPRIGCTPRRVRGGERQTWVKNGRRPRGQAYACISVRGAFAVVAARKNVAQRLVGALGRDQTAVGRAAGCLRPARRPRSHWRGQPPGRIDQEHPGLQAASVSAMARVEPAASSACDLAEAGNSEPEGACASVSSTGRHRVRATRTRRLVVDCRMAKRGAQLRAESIL